jgi:PIN domain nuclease of toxin-antitoxin system
VNYLLDTPVLVELLIAPQRVGPAVRRLLTDALNDVVVSAVSGWEIAIKTSMRKLSLPSDLETELLRAGISSLDITLADGLRAGALPRHHNDPFDRMLVAQAQSRGMTLVTRDAMLGAYGVPILAA